MGRFSKNLENFLDEIKDSHLQDMPSECTPKTLFSDGFFRLDHQNITSKPPEGYNVRCHNVQIQVNNGVPTNYDILRGQSIIKVFIPIDENWTAQKFVEMARKGVLPICK